MANNRPPHEVLQALGRNGSRRKVPTQDEALKGSERPMAKGWEDWGYPAYGAPCSVCWTQFDTRLEPRHGYVTCIAHADIPPNERRPMALLRKHPNGHWEFSTGKYGGIPLEHVAQADPGYLNWVWTTPKVYDFLPDDASTALEEAMERWRIPFDRASRPSS